MCKGSIACSSGRSGCGKGEERELRGLWARHGRISYERTVNAEGDDRVAGRGVDGAGRVAAICSLNMSSGRPVDFLGRRARHADDSVEGLARVPGQWRREGSRN